MTDSQICVFWVGFNVETVEYKNVGFTVWDVGGQDKVLLIPLLLFCHMLQIDTFIHDFIQKWHCGNNNARIFISLLFFYNGQRISLYYIWTNYESIEM